MVKSHAEWVKEFKGSIISGTTRALMTDWEEERSRVISALSTLLFLHQCEQEALGRPPTPGEWMTAVDKCNEVLESMTQ